jgi:hypothetical protein
MSCPATSSGLKTADAAIMAMPGRLMGLQVIPGSDAATVTLYDHASAASGTVLAKIVVDPTIEGSRELVISEGGIICNNGIYADVSGTDAAYIVHYALG